MQPEINDEVLGLLKSIPFDPGCYHSIVVFAPLEVIEVTVVTELTEDEDFPAVLETARRVYIALQSMKTELLQAVIEELLPTPEKGWIAGLITEDEFVARLKLKSIEIIEDGSSYVYYESIGLEEFIGDHLINVNVSSELKIKFVELSG